MKYQRTKLGQFMYDITLKGAKFLIKHKWLYYLLNFTWGILMTLLGLLIALIMLIIGKTPKINYTCIKFVIGDSWGGFSIGITYVKDKYSNNSVDYHEIGHSYQNAIYGPLWPLLVGIPSMIRYFYQVYIAPKLNKTVNAYDLIWFEGSATAIGELIK